MCLLTALLKMLHFILLLDALLSGLVLSQERQELWLPKDDLRDSSSWSSPPLMLLRDIHSKLIDQYDCKEVCAPSPSQVNAGAGARLSSQDGVSQHRRLLPSLVHRLTVSLRLPL